MGTEGLTREQLYVALTRGKHENHIYFSTSEADPHRILAMVMARSARLTALGLAAGGLLAYGLTRFLASLLFEVSPTEPAIYAALAALLALVAFLASYLPARRAARLDPLTAVRAGDK